MATETQSPLDRIRPQDRLPPLDPHHLVLQKMIQLHSKILLGTVQMAQLNQTDRKTFQDHIVSTVKHCTLLLCSCRSRQGIESVGHSLGGNRNLEGKQYRFGCRLDKRSLARKCHNLLVPAHMPLPCTFRHGMQSRTLNLNHSDKRVQEHTLCHPTSRMQVHTRNQPDNPCN